MRLQELRLRLADELPVPSQLRQATPYLGELAHRQAGRRRLPRPVRELAGHGQRHMWTGRSPHSYCSCAVAVLCN